MANPRKFSEKIALHNQKQAEETAEFERVMQECNVTRVMGAPQPRNLTHLQPHPQAFLRSYLSGSLPNVNQIAAHPQLELHHQPGFDESKHPMRHPPRFDSRPRPYVYAHRRHGMPLELGRHRMGPIDGPPGQYPGAYLSPPPESNWRSFALSRTNSDSALHQSVMNPNSQDPFNPNIPMHNQGRRDVNEINFNAMNPSYKAMLESKRFEQHLQNANRPKSCEAPNLGLLPTGESAPIMHASGDGPSIPLGGNVTVPTINPSLNQSLSHVTPIGNNTGSLPNLPALFNHPQSANPHDYNEQPSSHSMVSPNSPLYHQAQSTSNLPAATAISPHLTGPPRNPANPNRLRRTTFNGPSPLSISSPDHSRRMKFPSTTSPKVGIKPEMKSPPIGGPYNNPYPHPGSQGTWHMTSDHPGSPSHVQAMSPSSMSQTSSIPQQHMPHQEHMSHQAGGPLRIDVSAASKINQQPPSYPRGSHGVSVTSPLTSPTSPTSHCSQLSPVTSPRTDYGAGGNPTHPDPYYRPDMSSIQPLQHQFEHFHMVSDNGTPSQRSGAPPMYSSVMSSMKQNSLDGQSGSMAHHVSGPLHSAPAKLGNLSNHVSKIPHIVFTGVDEQHLMKTGSVLHGSDLGMMGHDGLSSVDYFGAAEDLKTNLGIEELRMLDESNITDPVIEDSLHLDHM